MNTMKMAGACPPCDGNCNQGRQCSALRTRNGGERIDTRLLLSSGAVQATKRPAWWRRALRALGVRA